MSQASEADDLVRFPYEQLANWLAEGKIVPFLGAGAARAGSCDQPLLPDGAGLAEELARKMPSYADRAGEGLAKIAQVFEQLVFDRDALYEHLHRRFEAEQRELQPGAVAAMLAHIPHADRPLFLITTNYDTSIERAFGQSGKPLCVITQNMRDPENGASAITLLLPDGTSETDLSAEFQWQDEDRFPPGCTFLFKMHGSVRRQRPGSPDDVIITEDDYVDFMVNCGGAVSPFFPPASLTSAYKQRRFLFLGYSLHDWNFRAFLRVLVLRNALSGREQKRHYAIQRAPEALEVDLWQRRNVSVYDGELGEFCKSLIARFPEETS